MSVYGEAQRMAMKVRMIMNNQLCVLPYSASSAYPPPQGIDEPNDRHGHEGKQQDVEDRIRSVRIIFPPLHAIGIHFLDEDCRWQGGSP